jgi:hypothetical protein
MKLSGLAGCQEDLGWIDVGKRLSLRDKEFSIVVQELAYLIHIIGLTFSSAVLQVLHLQRLSELTGGV